MTRSGLLATISALSAVQESARVAWDCKAISGTTSAQYLVQATTRLSSPTAARTTVALGCRQTMRRGVWEKGMDDADSDQGLMRLKAAKNVSKASCAAWVEAWGRPPTAATRSSRCKFRASDSDFPSTNSVNAEPHAMAATQPLALKRTSVILPAVVFKLSRNTSPQTGFSVSAAASA